MAYMDFSADPLLATYAAEPAAPAQDDGRLSALEWTVVALAQRDRMSSLAEPGRLAMAAAWSAASAASRLSPTLCRILAVMTYAAT